VSTIPKSVRRTNTGIDVMVAFDFGINGWTTEQEASLASDISCTSDRPAQPDAR